MLTRIPASCAACGLIDVAVADTLVIVGPETTAGRFRCTRDDCGAETQMTVTRAFADKLVAGGALAVSVDAAPPRNHPERPRPGATVTAEDVTRFAARLRDDDWFDDLAADTDL